VVGAAFRSSTPRADFPSLRTRPRMRAHAPVLGSIRGFVRRNESAVGSFSDQTHNSTGLTAAPQVTVSVSPSTSIVLGGSGDGAGGLTTEPSVIEYLLPWQSQLIVSVTFATGQF
jgi:hypothetical protein